MVLMLVAVAAHAQKFSVKGQVTDTLSAALPSTTVMLLNSKDSTLVNFGVSDLKGFFEIRNVNKGEYLLKITFVGYASHMQRIVTPTEPTAIDVGKIKLAPQTKELDAVVIQGEKIR